MIDHDQKRKKRWAISDKLVGKASSEKRKVVYPSIWPLSLMVLRATFLED